MIKILTLSIVVILYGCSNSFAQVFEDIRQSEVSSNKDSKFFITGYVGGGFITDYRYDRHAVSSSIADDVNNGTGISIPISANFLYNLDRFLVGGGIEISNLSGTSTNSVTGEDSEDNYGFFKLVGRMEYTSPKGKVNWIGLAVQPGLGYVFQSEGRSISPVFSTYVGLNTNPMISSALNLFVEPFFEFSTLTERFQNRKTTTNFLAFGLVAGLRFGKK